MAKKPAPAPAAKTLSHLGKGGEARMVDVSGKDATERVAVAEGKVVMKTETLDIVLNGNAVKGDVLGAARIAGIMAAKRTHQLIPLCHPLPITKVAIDIEPDHSLPGFVLHMPLGQWQSTLAVSREVGLTTSKDILQAVARGEGPRQLLVTLGYAGWAPGQLEHELAQNAWLTVQAKAEVIFELPAEDRLPAAMSLLGIDFASLSEQAGHA